MDQMSTKSESGLVMVGMHPWKHLFQQYTGATIHDMDPAQFRDKQQWPHTVTVHELALMSDPDLFLSSPGCRTLVLVIERPPALTEQLVNRIEQAGLHTDLHILADGYFDRQLNNVTVHAWHPWEQQFAHHNSMVLSHILSQHRKPDKDFLMILGRREPYRERLAKHLEESGCLDNSITHFFTYQSRWPNIFDYYDHLRAKADIPGLQDWLSAFANGVPNFDWYRRIRYEIVTETANSGHVMMGEKTWRPIAFGIPMVYTAGKTLHEQLTRYGFRFYDPVGFYQAYHSTMDEQQKFSMLSTFLDHLRHKGDHAEAERLALHNKNLFWNTRRNDFVKHFVDQIKQIYKINTVWHDLYDAMGE